MDIGVRSGMTWLNFNLVPMAISSVLSSFIFNLLSPIHSATSSIQSFKQQARTGKSEGTLDLWSWESSAKKWYERRDWQITVLRGCVYRVNRRGPRTEPFSTQHSRKDGVDSWSTNTDWVQQLNTHKHTKKKKKKRKQDKKEKPKRTDALTIHIYPTHKTS